MVVKISHDFISNRNGKQVSWLPFNFTLPFDIPSSYESDYGNVRYTIKAVLKRNQLLKRNFVNKTRIVVTRLPEPITQQSVNQHQVQRGEM